MWVQLSARKDNWSLQCIRLPEPGMPSALGSFPVGACRQRAWSDGWRRRSTSTPPRLRAPLLSGPLHPQPCSPAPRPGLHFSVSLSLAVVPLCNYCWLIPSQSDGWFNFLSLRALAWPGTGQNSKVPGQVAQEGGVLVEEAREQHRAWGTSFPAQCHFDHCHPGVTWLSQSLLPPTQVFWSQKKLNGIQEPWAVSLLQTLDKRGNGLTSQSKLRERPSSSYAPEFLFSRPLSAPSPSLSPQTSLSSPPSGDWVSGTFFGETVYSGCFGFSSVTPQSSSMKESTFLFLKAKVYCLFRGHTEHLGDAEFP